MAPHDIPAPLRAEFLAADLLVNARTLTLLGGSGWPRHGDCSHYESGRYGS
jgi:hypothetical protein